ncbi:hypothetical protein FPSE_01710 [Fusarium pseudograminearum CS3096]|uniref:F-box domain-containing protein n=1 Tax=Fusarium pseudograminearum (strain CS3096) TaxID=1028729 RepID=K3VSH4_FUSPC|nr:hypothetical protein FPSE_01710 [Fusarium pseudograminearum CS3096]EKJ78249.1 hypothetical protein FPSE_01710 [Fusarium pseudograminearum CS3096]KAF0643812.1 hypothetical protein FPSE5266_01710 [Fusarium pseudograminearum]
MESDSILGKGDRSPYVRLLKTLADKPILAGKIRALRLSKAEPEFDNIHKIRAALQNLTLDWSLVGRLRRCLNRSGAASLLLAHAPQVELVECEMANCKSGIPWMLSGILGLEDKVDFHNEIRRIDDRFAFLVEEAKLFFNSDPRNMNTQLTGRLRNKSVNYSPLQNLREVRIMAKDVKEAFLLAWSIEPILLNPNLKTLRTRGVDWYMDEKEMFVWPTHQSNLECLDLQQTILDGNTLKKIMTRCPKLKSLFIDLADLYTKRDDSVPDDNLRGGRSHYGSDSDDEEQYDDGSFSDPDARHGDPVCDVDVNLTDISNVLREHGGNIEELAFCTFLYEQDWIYYSWGGIGSLRELTKLRYLKIEHWKLLGSQDDDLYDNHSMNSSAPSLKYKRFSDVLPASIETLYIYNIDVHPGASYKIDEAETINALVKAFLAEAETWAPNLQKIVVEWWQSTWKWEDFCERDWSRETVDDGWDIKFIEAPFEHELPEEHHKMIHVILTKKEKGRN